MAAALWAIGGAVLGGGLGFFGVTDKIDKIDQQQDAKINIKTKFMSFNMET